MWFRMLNTIKSPISSFGPWFSSLSSFSLEFPRSISAITSTQFNINRYFSNSNIHFSNEDSDKSKSGSTSVAKYFSQEELSKRKSLITTVNWRQEVLKKFGRTGLTAPLKRRTISSENALRYGKQLDHLWWKRKQHINPDMVMIKRRKVKRAKRKRWIASHMTHYERELIWRLTKQEEAICVDLDRISLAEQWQTAEKLVNNSLQFARRNGWSAIDALLPPPESARGPTLRPSTATVGGTAAPKTSGIDQSEQKRRERAHSLFVSAKQNT